MTILLIVALAFADCEPPNTNLANLKAIQKKFKQHEVVPLNPDRPWILVTPAARDWALWHNGKLRPDGGENETK